MQFEETIQVLDVLVRGGFVLGGRFEAGLLFHQLVHVGTVGDKLPQHHLPLGSRNLADGKGEGVFVGVAQEHGRFEYLFQDILRRVLSKERP